jgi:Glycosyl transferase family 2
MASALKYLSSEYPIVAVPARNEEERLPHLIRSLGNQTWLGVKGRRLHVVLVLNNCDDASAKVALREAAYHPNLFLDLIKVDFPAEDANVGSARRLAMERAWQISSDPTRTVLLTTDADSAPMRTWIDANLRAIEAGADIVGGKIVGNEAEEASLGARFLQRAGRRCRYAALIDRLAALIDPLPYDPWPRHSDHTGASLAVRANVYAAVGGIPALPRREDLAFVSRVRGSGYRLRHPADVRVKVSARLNGRASGGMADCIKGWVEAEEKGLPHLVESPMSVTARLRRRRKSRHLEPSALVDLFEIISGVNVASKFGVNVASKTQSPSSLRGLSIPALIELVAPEEPDAPSTVPVEVAIGQIERIISDTQRGILVA